MTGVRESFYFYANSPAGAISLRNPGLSAAPSRRNLPLGYAPRSDWWVLTGSNRRHSPCKGASLPVNHACFQALMALLPHHCHNGRGNLIMATIRKRGEFSWEAQVRRKGHPTLTKTFIYKSDAEAWARMTESEIERGVFISRTTAENTTLKEVLERYEREITAAKRGKAKESYILSRFKDSRLASRAMATIRSADIAAWRDERLTKVGPATVKREMVVLSHVFTISRKEWGMEGLQNPVQTTTKPKEPRGRDRRISENEIKAICAASESPELPAIVRLAIETGMRRSEIVGLEWSDIDLKSRTVHLDETKNGEPRDVPLSSAALATLTALPRRISGRVFGFKPDSATQAFIRAVRRARKTYEAECMKKGANPDPEYLVGIRLHDGRHEGTSRFLEKGLDVMEAASITGHKDLRMLKRYTHLRAEDLARKLG